ncbi:MAG: hypothetical protein C0490_06205, partial [Marivirga sp.]|nr:hypothetical protein [Marivirga sp.]
MTTQSDGKIIVAGNFSYSGNTIISNIIRLNADGTRDVTFDTGIGMSDNSGYSVSANEILVQPDGKILVGGFFSNFNGVAKKSLVRLNPDGSLDNTFNDFTSTTPSTGSGNGIVNGMALQSDGKIIVRGLFETVNGTAHKGIARLNADGSVDNTFNTTIVASVGGSAFKEPVVVRSDGKILVSGRFTSVNNVTYNRIVRLNTDGTTDTSFDPGTGFNDDVHSMVVQSDGKILLCGKFTGFNGTTVNRLLRLNENGSLDTGFPYTINFNTGNWVDKIALQADGKILVGGSFQTPAMRILRLTSAGAIDGTFSAGTGPEALTANGVSSIAFSASKIYLGGDFITYNGNIRNGLVVVNTSGAIDTGIDLKLGIPATVNSAHLQSDGKLVVGGNFTYINGTIAVRIGRINTDGSLDNSFITGTGFNNIVQAVSAQSDGKLLVGGTFASYNGTTVNRIIRLNTNGTRDAGFAPAITTSSSVDGVYRIHCYSDDKILIGGGFTKVNGNTYKNLARLNSSGTSDLTFNNNAFTALWLMDMDVRESDGAIVATSNVNGAKDLALLDANGTVVNGFDAKTRISQPPVAVSFTPDGKVLFGGTFTYDGGSARKLIKLDMNADLDPLFNFTSLTSDVASIKVVNNKYLIGYGDYYGFSSGKFDITSEQGTVFTSAIPLYGNTKEILKASNEFYVVGRIANPDVSGVNGVLKFSIPALSTSAPTALQATVQQGKVILTWTYNLSDELGFVIYRAKSGEPFTAVGAASTGITTFTDLTSDPETQYKYIVKAAYLSGDSPASNEVDVTTLPDKPKAPSNLVLAETSPIEILLTWRDNSINEAEMLIYRLGPGESSYSLLTRLPANTTTYNDQLLTPGKTYSYYLKAGNPLGESVASPTKSLTLSDPTFGAWSNKNPATGVQRYSAVSFVIGNKAYVGTGGNATGRLKDFWEYDPASDSWTKKADFPGTARVGATGFAINGKGYIGTGNDGTLEDGMVKFRRDFYQYDPVQDTWTQVADYPEDFTSEAGISAGVSFVIGNYAYTGLGNNGVNNPNDFYRYDPVTNQWTKMANFAGTGRSSAVSFAGNGKGYIGLGGVGTKYNDVWEYDPGSNLWTKLTTNFTSTARAGAVA